MYTSAFADVLGVRTHYLEGGEGPAVLFLHGGGPANCAELTWRRQLDHFPSRARTLALDELGFGRTGHPHDDDFTLMARTRHAEAFLEALDLRDVVLVGHSQGGFIATVLAIRRPERVTRLVIASSGTTSPKGNFTPDDVFSPRVQEFISFSSKPTFENFVALRRTNSFRPERLDPQLLRRAFDDFVTNGNLDAYVRGTERPLTRDPAGFAGLYAKEIEPHLARLQLPVTIAWGREDDFAYARRGYELFARLPDAEFHVFSGCKHNLPADQAEAFNTLVEQALADR